MTKANTLPDFTSVVTKILVSLLWRFYTPSSFPKIATIDTDGWISTNVDEYLNVFVYGEQRSKGGVWGRQYACAYFDLENSFYELPENTEHSIVANVNEFPKEVVDEMVSNMEYNFLVRKTLYQNEVLSLPGYSGDFFVNMSGIPRKRTLRLTIKLGDELECLNFDINGEQTQKVLEGYYDSVTDVDYCVFGRDPAYMDIVKTIKRRPRISLKCTDGCHKDDFLKYGQPVDFLGLTGFDLQN